MLKAYCPYCESNDLESEGEIYAYTDEEVIKCKSCCSEMLESEVPLEDTIIEELLHGMIVTFDDGDKYEFNRFILFGMDEEGNTMIVDNGLNLQNYMIGVADIIDNYKSKIAEKGLGKR